MMSFVPTASLLTHNDHNCCQALYMYKCSRFYPQSVKMQNATY